jgi:serine/threonine protein kinase
MTPRDHPLPAIPSATAPEPPLPPASAMESDAAPTQFQHTTPLESPSCEPLTTPYGTSSPTGPIAAFGTFGRYELLGEAKAGGMGIVYKARDTALDRIVALKMLKTGGRAGLEEVARFQREARAVGRLNHPNIVPIYDVAQEQGLHFLTMEYLPGGNLAQHVGRYTDNPRAAAILVEKVARAVHHAHVHQILHRDLKPSNILLDEHGEPHVSDFGLAKILDAPSHHSGLGGLPETTGDASPRLNSKLRSSDTDLHTLGAVGTPLFMAPEQLTGGVITASADVWSLGVILYQMLAGRLPFAARDVASLTEQIVKQPPLWEFRPGVDPALQRICLKCLEKDPAERYSSAEALADALSAWHGGGPLWKRPIRFARRRPLLAASLILLIGAVVAFGVVALSPADPDQALHDMQAELEQSKTVTLIGETGKPKWSRWAVGDDDARVVSSQDEVFTIHSPRVALLELLPDPRVGSYRLSALIRQRHVVGGDVGLYFGHCRMDTGKAVLHWVCPWKFGDRPAVGGEPAFIWLKLQCVEAPGLQEDAFHGNQSFLDHKDSGRFGDWRHLALEVTPTEMRVSWEGKNITKPKNETIRVQPMLADFREQYGADLKKLGFPPDHADPPIGGRAGLGLYVNQCTASFRNVVIEPLPDAN